MSILSVTIGNMRRSRGIALQLAGVISDGGVRYSLYVSPRIGGQYGATSTIAGGLISWKTTNTAGPAGVQTLTNGLNATNVMIAANTPTVIYQAADFAMTARTALVGGYNDWYVPARDELELCYRNLKGSTSNNTTNTIRSTAFYNGGYGIDNKATGYNANSDPVGAAYTAGTPGQTSVMAFRTNTGTGEGFVRNYHISSTELNTAEYWVLAMGAGGESTFTKNANAYLRLIRRVAA